MSFMAPKLVMITLKLADSPHSTRITEDITRIISIPSMTVQPVWQVMRSPGGPNNPNQPLQPPLQQPLQMR